MSRVLNIVILLAVVLALGAWALGLTGNIEIRAGEYWIGASLTVAVMLAGIAFVAFHLLLRLYSWMLRTPERRKMRVALDNGAMAEIAVTRAMVALAAGLPSTARAELNEARRLAGETAPLLAMEAEAARADGDDAAVTAAYEALARRDDARFLGLQGLMEQARARGDADAQARLAAEAAKAEPRAQSLRLEQASAALGRQDWREALALAPDGVPQAPLALAAALDAETAAEARGFERQAFRADPGFAPAAVALAVRLGGDAGQSVLRQGWEAGPNPMIATAWIGSVSDPAERLHLVDELTRTHVAHPESRALRALVAIQAGELVRARQDLMAWEDAGELDRRWYQLMEALEQGEQGLHFSREAAQAWQRRAQAAPLPPAWICGACGAQHAQWAPQCSACGTGGKIGWTTPGPMAAAGA
jgi:HemY protein